MTPLPASETIFKFLAAIFFLIFFDLFFHPIPNIIVLILLLIAFVYMGYGTRRTE